MTALYPPDWFSGRRVLITGGLGFIGSNLARQLVCLGGQVTVLDSLVPEYGGNLYNIDGVESELRVNISDVRDPFSMRTLLEGQDVLFNLAGQTSHMDSMIDPQTDLQINCAAQLSILEACREVNPTIRIVFGSTRQIYGKPEFLPVDEEHPLRPTDVNGVNKMAGEWYHLLYHRVYGLPTSVLRLTNTYGPRMRIKDARQTFLGVWVRALVEGKPFEVWDGGQLRDFTYVSDCVEAMLAVAASDRAVGLSFNLGGDRPVSLEELANLLVSIGKGGTFETRTFPADRKKIDIGDYYADFGLIERTLGWVPKVNLESGLKMTVDYYRKNLEHYL